MAICTEKPDVPLDAIALEAVGDLSHYPMTRGGSGRHRTSSAAMPPPISRQASMSGFKPNTPGGFTMGNFSTPTNKMTGDERFALSQRSTSGTVTGPGMPFGRPGQMARNVRWDDETVHPEGGAPQVCKPRHSKYYFGSGNVVFVCEDTSFRVQSDLLSTNSQVFSDMLEQTSLKGEHRRDGCPCVHLSDTAEDFATLLRVFYTSGCVCRAMHSLPMPL